MSDRRSESWRWLAIPLGGAAALIAVNAVAPSVPAPPLLGYVVAFAAISGLTLASAGACPARTRRDLRWLIGPLACLAMIAWSGGRDVWHAAAVLACLLIAGGLLGSVVGASIEHAGHLLFVAIVSSLADAASVLHPSGPSAAIVESEQALSLLALPFAFLGTSETPPLLGVGDVVFAALYAAAGRRHGLPVRRTMLALAVAFALTMLTVMTFELPVPALPFLGVATLAAHPEARRPPAADLRRGMAVIGVLVLALVGLWLSR
jgi:hypothetical protein